MKQTRPNLVMIIFAFYLGLIDIRNNLLYPLDREYQPSLDQQSRLKTNFFPESLKKNPDAQGTLRQNTPVSVVQPDLEKKSFCLLDQHDQETAQEAPQEKRVLRRLGVRHLCQLSPYFLNNNASGTMPTLVQRDAKVSQVSAPVQHGMLTQNPRDEKPIHYANETTIRWQGFSEDARQDQSKEIIVKESCEDANRHGSKEIITEEGCEEQRIEKNLDVKNDATPLAVTLDAVPIPVQNTPIPVQTTPAAPIPVESTSDPVQITTGPTAQSIVPHHIATSFTQRPSSVVPQNQAAELAAERVVVQAQGGTAFFESLLRADRDSQEIHLNMPDAVLDNEVYIYEPEINSEEGIDLERERAEAEMKRQAAEAQAKEAAEKAQAAEQQQKIQAEELAKKEAEQKRLAEEAERQRQEVEAAREAERKRVEAEAQAKEAAEKVQAKKTEEDKQAADQEQKRLAEAAEMKRQEAELAKKIAKDKQEAEKERLRLQQEEQKRLEAERLEQEIQAEELAKKEAEQKRLAEELLRLQQEAQAEMKKMIKLSDYDSVKVKILENASAIINGSVLNIFTVNDSRAKNFEKQVIFVFCELNLQNGATIRDLLSLPSSRITDVNGMKIFFEEYHKNWNVDYCTKEDFYRYKNDMVQKVDITPFIVPKQEKTGYLRRFITGVLPNPGPIDPSLHLEKNLENLEFFFYTPFFYKGAVLNNFGTVFKGTHKKTIEANTIYSMKKPIFVEVFLQNQAEEDQEEVKTSSDGRVIDFIKTDVKTVGKKTTGIIMEDNSLVKMVDEKINGLTVDTTKSALAFTNILNTPERFKEEKTPLDLDNPGIGTLVKKRSGQKKLRSSEKNNKENNENNENTSPSKNKALTPSEIKYSQISSQIGNNIMEQLR